MNAITYFRNRTSHPLKVKTDKIETSLVDASVVFLSAENPPLKLCLVLKANDKDIQKLKNH